MADACHKVTTITVEGIPMGPAGAHSVDVTFAIRVDGTLDIKVERDGLPQE